MCSQLLPAIYQIYAIDISPAPAFLDELLIRTISLFFCIAAALLLPSFLWSSGYSDSVKYNYVWVAQFAAEMARGHLYPRWLPDSFDGLGSPTFYFYPPLAYWVAGGFGAFGLPTLTAINLMALIALALSGLAMNQWLAALGVRSRLGAILYMASPYHLMDFYVRGALGEFVGFMWLPWIALGIHRLPQRRGVIMLALSYAGLILSHLPLAMLTTFFLIGPLTIYAVSRDSKLLVPLIMAGSLGLALSAFYLLGALTLQGSISSALLWTPYYRAVSWSLLTPGSLLLSHIGFATLAVGIALLVALHTRSIWTLITLIAAVNVLGLVPGIWQVQPFAQAQFPWRLLGIVEFAGITALLRPQAAETEHRKASPVLLGLSAGLILFTLGQWGPLIAASMRTPVDYARLTRDLPDAPEYLPAGFDTRLVREDLRETDLREWRNLPRRDTIAVTHPGEITFRHAAFPIWSVTRDSREVPYKGPIIHVDARPGVYRIERRMIWQESVGTVVSTLAMIVLCIFAMPGRAARPSQSPALAPVAEPARRPSPATCTSWRSGDSS